MKDSLDFIYKQQKELSHFGGIGALLGWDQMTYMPPKGIEERAEQLSLISRLAHERVISDEFYQHIQRLASVQQALAEKDRKVVLRLKDDVEKARKVPAAFVEKMSKATSLAYSAWEQARAKQQFSLFAPHLETVIDLERQYCDLIKLPGHPYNSLLDDFEEGMTAQKLQEACNYVPPHAREVLEEITTSPNYEKQQPLNMKHTVKQQQTLCNHFLKLCNLPFDRSRLDVSTHPFTTSMGDDDVRITTNYGRGEPLFSFFSTIHEAGHALYELGMLKGEYKDTVMSDSPSMGLHESQSRFWENMIGHSQAFWEYFAPQFQTTAPSQYRGISAHTWYEMVNHVRPSFIRIESDELTYNLHIILRFELELVLMEGKITVKELPDCWNQKMTDLLGITPKNDAEGVLQDMHWSGGEFGYFPTYAIGTIYSSQLYKSLMQEQPQIQDEISQGKFSTILTWLTAHVHQYGRLMTADEIIQKTCGEGLNSKIFVQYLKEKYYPLYDV